MSVILNPPGIATATPETTEPIDIGGKTFVSHHEFDVRHEPRRRSRSPIMAAMMAMLASAAVKAPAAPPRRSALPREPSPARNNRNPRSSRGTWSFAPFGPRAMSDVDVIASQWRKDNAKDNATARGYRLKTLNMKKLRRSARQMLAARAG